MNRTFTVTSDLYAGKRLRLANYFIDLLVFYVLFMVLVSLLGLILVLIGGDLESFLYQLENTNPLLDRLISAIMYALLYFTLESLLKGRSIGKYITKTKVVDINGNVPTVGSLMKRSFSRLIPFEIFSFLGEEGRGWHDSISDTYVVDVQKLEDKKTVALGIEELGRTEDEQ